MSNLGLQNMTTDQNVTTSSANYKTLFSIAPTNKTQPRDNKCKIILNWRRK